MKDYTLDELKSLSEEKLGDIAKAILAKEIKFADDKMQIVCDRLYMYTSVHKDIIEYRDSAILISHVVLPEEVAALKEAYLAYELKNWAKCKSALEVFFEWADSDFDLQYFDLSRWSYEHVSRWFGMLTMTELSETPEGTSAQMFSQIIWEQVIDRMPKHLKPKLFKGLEKFYPEIAELVSNSKTVTEDGTKCIDISDVAKHLEVSEEAILQMFEGTEPGKYMVTKDKVYTIH